jgi:hypothetical protein
MTRDIAGFEKTLCATKLYRQASVTAVLVWILSNRESTQITQEFKIDNLARVVLGAGASSKRPANRECIKEMRTRRSSGWHSMSETIAPRGAYFLDLDESNWIVFPTVAMHRAEILQLHVSAPSLVLHPCWRCSDLVDAALDLHLLQNGLAPCVFATFSALGATQFETRQQHETPATVCWIVTTKIKTSFSQGHCIEWRLVKICDRIKPP